MTARISMREVRELVRRSKEATSVIRLQITCTWIGYHVYRVGFAGQYVFDDYLEPTLGFIEKPMTIDEMFEWLKAKHKELDLRKKAKRRLEESEDE